MARNRRGVHGQAAHRGAATARRPAGASLDDFGARTYAAAYGRFLQVDPLWAKHPGWTPYHYVLDNPLALVDPDGRQVRPTSPGQRAIREGEALFNEVGRRARAFGSSVVNAVVDYGPDLGIAAVTSANLIPGDEVAALGVIAARRGLLGGAAASADDVARLLPQFSRSTAREAQGLVGTKFELFLRQTLNGSGEIRAGGRTFDTAVGNLWIEAKSGGAFSSALRDPSRIEALKNQLGAQVAIARQNNKSFQVISNTPIPSYWQSWLREKGIGFVELLP